MSFTFKIACHIQEAIVDATNAHVRSTRSSSLGFLSRIETISFQHEEIVATH